MLKPSHTNFLLPGSHIVDLTKHTTLYTLIGCKGSVHYTLPPTNMLISTEIENLCLWLEFLTFIGWDMRKNMCWSLTPCPQNSFLIHSTMSDDSVSLKWHMVHGTKLTCYTLPHQETGLKMVFPGKYGLMSASWFKRQVYISLYICHHWICNLPGTSACAHIDGKGDVCWCIK